MKSTDQLLRTNLPKACSPIKNRSLIWLIILFVLFLGGRSNAQVTVAGSTGANATYATLGAAFTAINTNINQKGNNIVITITASTTETATASLTGQATNSWTTLKIYPTTSGLSISGNLAAPLIDLNGADNVTIDGSVNQGDATKDLIITNTSTSSTAGTSTIRFVNAATGNSVKYCKIKGSTTARNGTALAGGIIFFSTATAVGNNSNTIDNNDITNATDNDRPYCAIYSLGSATYVNSSNTISNNNIFNFLNRNFSSTYLYSYGIYLVDYNTAWTISGNSFYETAPLTQTVTNGGSATCSMIFIDYSNFAGVNYSISNNHIGGSAALCSGTWTISNAYSSVFSAVQVKAGTTPASNLQGNVITNFNLNYTLSTGINLYGINIAGGSWDVGTTSANTIGATTGTGSITYTCAGDGNFEALYMYSSSGNTINVRNNNIGSITTTNTNSTSSTSFYGIYPTGAADFNINSNLIGSTDTQNSIYASSASTTSAQNMAGIYCQATGTVSISDNTIAHITNGTTNSTAGTAGTIQGIYVSSGTNTISGNTVRDLTIANANTAANHTASVVGIALNYTTGNVQSISGNTIYNLSNTNASFAGSVIGLYYSGVTTASAVSGNFIRSLSVTGASSTAANLYGIKIAAGATSYFNNIINLGGDTKTNIYGIYDTGASTFTCNLYFNSVYIGGSLASGVTNKSYALYSAAYSNTRDFRNNIFANTRSTAGGASLHYAAYIVTAGVTAGQTFTCDYNDYYVSGTGSKLGYYGGDKTVLPIATSVTGNDANSLVTNPLFASAGGTLAANYIPASPFLMAASGTGISTDYAGTSRTAPSSGAYEVAVSPIVTLTATAGTAAGSYSNLKGAFDAINAGTHQGTILVKINGSTFEGVSAVLNASATGSSSYTSIKIYPTVTGLSITGNLSVPLIDLNGADNVTIDGSVNQGDVTIDLIITNTSTSATAGTSTIRFINDASYNTISYCNVLGSSTTVGSNTSNPVGNILFSTGITTGNDNNTISYCKIGPAGVNLPSKGIYSLGTNTTSATCNSTITIDHCEIFDYFLSAGSGGVWAGNGSTDWTISNNKIYQTAARTFTSTGNIFGIHFSNTTWGNNIQITGNTIGYANNSGTGTFDLISTNAGGFRGIDLYVLPTASSACNITGNTISNISNTSNGLLYGIYNGTTASSNTININNNTVTNFTHTGSGIITAIYAGTASNLSVSGNSINAIARTTSATGNTLYGIDIENGSNAITAVVSSNSIFNLSTTTTSTSSCIKGIYFYNLYTGAMTCNVYNNAISDLRAPGCGSDNSVNAIYIEPRSTPTNVFNLFYNTIYLDGTSPSGSYGGSSGIYVANISSDIIDLRNNIIINKWSPGSSGYAVAYRIITSGMVHSSNSNNNNFYAGTPGAHNLIYFDGTSDQTLGAFQTRVSGEANSISENTTFVSTSTTPYNLHLSPSVVSLCNSGGIPVASPFAITTDFDGNLRHATTPDIGAMEFAGSQVSSVISSGGTLSAFATCAGTASAYQNFTASGSGLTANIAVTAPTGFEVCLTSGGTYTGSVTLTQVAGTVASTTVYARLAASATGTPSGNVALTSTGATTVNVAASGAISQSPTAANAGADQSNCNNGSFTLAGNSPSVGTGAWSVVSGTAAIASPTAANSGVTGVPSGTSATLRWTISNSPCTASTDDVVLTNNSLPAVASITGTTSLTLGTTTNLSCTTAGGSWSSSDTGVATVSTGVVSSIAVGSATISYTVTDVNGCSNSSTVPVTIGKNNQTISFTLASPQTVGASPIDLNGTATSGLAISYVSSNTGVAIISGNTITIIGAGTTAISASQSGNAYYNAAPDVVLVLTVNACENPTNGGIISMAQSICLGSTPPAFSSTLNATGQAGTLEYKWQVSNTSASAGFSDIASSNSAIYAPGALTTTTWYKRLARVTCKSDWTGAAQSNVIKITVDPLSVGGTISGSATVCSGSNSTTLTLSGYTGRVIKWQKSTDGWLTFTDVANTTTSLSAINLTATTSYRAVLQSGVCATANSAAAVVTVNPVAQVNQIANQILCNSSVTSAVNFSTTNAGGTTTYAWSNSNSGIGLAASGTGTIAPFTAVNTSPIPVIATITVTPTYTGGGVSCTGPAKTFTITVNADLVGNSSGVSLPICNNNAATLQGGSVMGGSWSFTYLWESSADGLTGWSAAAGTNTTANYTTAMLTTASSQVYFRRTVYSGGCKDVAAGVRVTVNPVVAGDTNCDGRITYPEIAGDTNGNGRIDGGEIAGDTSGDGKITAPEISGDTNGDGKITAPEIAGDSNGNMIIDSTEIMGDSNGDGKISGTEIAGDSNGDGKIAGGEISGDTAVLFNVPPSQLICSGSTAPVTTLTVGNTGGTTTYAWTNDKSGIGLAASGTGNIPSFTAINPGAAAVVATIQVIPTFTVGMVSRIGQAKSFTITVNPLPAGTAGADRLICPGSTTILGAPVIAGEAYVWSSLPAGFTSVAANPVVSPTVTARYVVTEINTVTGCSNSQSVLVTVKPTYQLSVSGTSTLCAGTKNVVYSTTPGMTTYQWTLPSGAAIVSGANTSLIAVDFSNTATSGNVRVSGTTDCGTVLSDNLSVSVKPLPATPTFIVQDYTLISSVNTGNQWYLGGQAVTIGGNGRIFSAPGGGSVALQQIISGCASALSPVTVVIPMAANTLALGAYPNPNHGQFQLTMEFSKQGYFTIDIYNDHSQLLYRKVKVYVDKFYIAPIDLYGVSSGTYYVRAYNADASMTIKVMVKR